MSIRTWKREFYSPISRCKKADALAHVLKKYLGTQKAAMKRHGVKKEEIRLTDGLGIFYFGTGSCALCKFYGKSSECSPQCSLKTKSGKRCFDVGRPYRVWADTGNPEPLIRALRRAIKKQAAAEKE